ncbi:uncharacterized protein LOC128854006 isoform X2 [Cuculus canorus]|uniref:uncharacterized protein LOC128854006 isoform X2 n=1 Tax=Cuculus canorus TaxID=55661 RepID=UPI0023AA3A08|nr:uncharacterized protein LOC128854006 isoform X2 [Cuculus canorus]
MERKMALFIYNREADPKRPPNADGFTLRVPLQCWALCCCKAVCLYRGQVLGGHLQSKCLRCAPCPHELEEPEGPVKRGPCHQLLPGFTWGFFFPLSSQKGSCICWEVPCDVAIGPRGWVKAQPRLFCHRVVVTLFQQAVAMPVSQGCVAAAGCSYHKSEVWSSCAYLAGQNHRNMEWVGLEGTSQPIQSHPCHGQGHLPLDQGLRAPSNLAWNPSRDGAATTALGTLGQGLPTRTAKHFFLMSHLNLPSFSLKEGKLQMTQECSTAGWRTCPHSQHCQALERSLLARKMFLEAALLSPHPGTLAGCHHKAGSLRIICEQEKWLHPSYAVFVTNHLLPCKSSCQGRSSKSSFNFCLLKNFSS